MRIHAANTQHNATGARPASGSAFLAGQVVTVTIPTLAMSDGLLAIGDEWTELRFSFEGGQMRAPAEDVSHGTENSRPDGRARHPGTLRAR